MQRTGIIIQGRMGSERLPGKVLLPLAGRTILWHVYVRCQRLKLSNVVVATSDLPQDQVIVDFCHSQNFQVFRGSETDLVSRYFDCAQKYRFDIILRISADCPLADPFIMQQCLDALTHCRGDFSTTNHTNINLPLGIGASAFTFGTLSKVHMQARSKFDREHVDPYIYSHPDKFNICSVKLPPRYDAPFRLILDEAADYELLKYLYNRLYYFPRGISTLKVLAYLKSHPRLARLNQRVIQKT